AQDEADGCGREDQRPRVEQVVEGVLRDRSRLHERLLRVVEHLAVRIDAARERPHERRVHAQTFGHGSSFLGVRRDGVDHSGEKSMRLAPSIFDAAECSREETRSSHSRWKRRASAPLQTSAAMRFATATRIMASAARISAAVLLSETREIRPTIGLLSIYRV